MSIPEYVAGIDLGCDNSVVCKVSTRSLKTDICRNDVSNEKTPTIVSFSGKERCFGEVAEQMKSANRANTIDSLLRYFDQFHRSDRSDFQPLIGTFETQENGKSVFQVSYDGQDHKLVPEQVLGMYLRKLESFTGEKLPIAISVPDCFSDSHVQALRDAAVIGGVDLRSVIRSTEAAMLDYGTKRSAEALGDSVVCIVDVGHGFASAAVYQWDGKKGKKIASSSLEGIGGQAIEEALFEALCKDCEERKGEKVVPGSKGAIRLMSQCRKLKENLSAVPSASITVEMLVGDDDVTFKFTRDQLAQVCQPILERFTSMLQSVKDQCPEEVFSQLKTCELIGGAMRSPLIRDAIIGVLGEGVSLAYTVDSMSAVSMGTSIHCAQLFQPTSGGVHRPAFDNVALFEIQQVELLADESRSSTTLLSLEEIQAAVELEHLMQGNDAKLLGINEAKNKLESYVYEMRNIAESSRIHANLINKEECLAVLDKYEEWMYEDLNEESPSEAIVYLEKFSNLASELEKSCSVYYEKVEADRVAKEQDLEREAAEAAAELEANGGKDDHDTRRLKKPERMRKVTMNKEEGNTLFKDGNFEAAALRYIRALQHCEKFYDMSPADIQELDAIKLSLHLNLAQCYLKAGKWDDVVKSAQNALQVDPDSTKALYRLAYAQENSKEFDKAKTNLLKAAKIDPEDKAIGKLLERVNAQIKREDAKRKKMAQKMFG